MESIKDNVGRNYTEYVKKLECKGYKCTHYSDITIEEGLAYYETATSVLKIAYEWIKIGDNRYKSGLITGIEDVTECYI